MYVNISAPVTLFTCVDVVCLLAADNRTGCSLQVGDVPCFAQRLGQAQKKSQQRKQNGKYLDEDDQNQNQRRRRNSEAKGEARRQCNEGADCAKSRPVTVTFTVKVTLADPTFAGIPVQETGHAFTLALCEDRKIQIFLSFKAFTRPH
jgi:hypothetical protein